MLAGWRVESKGRGGEALRAGLLKVWSLGQQHQHIFTPTRPAGSETPRMRPSKLLTSPPVGSGTC